MIGVTSFVNVGTPAVGFAAYCSRPPDAPTTAAHSTEIDAPRTNFIDIHSPKTCGKVYRRARRSGVFVFFKTKNLLTSWPSCEGFYLTMGVGACDGVKRMPVYCISSQVWSPHFTSDFGSGFALLPAELSYQAVDRSLAPLGTCSGSLNM